MEIEKFFELAKTLEKKKKGKKEEVEKFQKFFDRFHLLNRAYLDKETFEKARDSISSMTEVIANTVRYLDEEISRLRNKGRKLPLENVALAEMQKTRKRNEMLVGEFLSGMEK